MLTIVAMAVAGCGDDTAAAPPAAQVIEALVLEVAEEVRADPERPEALPVVYVVSESDVPFSAQVQARVASAVVDVVDVRFADDRDESMDLDQPGSPVRDGGALVLIDKLLVDDAPMHVDVEVYRSSTQFSRRVVTFARADDEWSASAHSVVEEMNVPPTTEPSDPVSEDGATGSTVSSPVTSPITDP